MTRSPENRSAIEARLKPPPSMTSLFVKTTRERLKNFMLKPFANKNFSKRVFINKAAGLKAYLYKAYHTGKGDDFESVAVIIANPSLPIDCSKMGVFGQQKAAVGVSNAARTPGPPIDDKTDAALWLYGGHFFTFQIDTRNISTAAENALGKGVFPVQLDYVIIKPPVWEPSEKGGRIVKQKAEVTIIEYKGGPDQRIMAASEGVQLMKGAKFFQHHYGGSRNVDVKLFYAPYLAQDPRVWGPTWPPNFHIDYLVLPGLSKLLGIPQNVIENWGSARANWLKKLDTKINSLTTMVEEILEEIPDEKNKNTYIQALARRPANRVHTLAPGKTVNFTNLMTNLNAPSNLNWKNRHQQLMRALATREYLKALVATDPRWNQTLNMYNHAISKLNKLNAADSGILTSPMRARVAASLKSLNKQIAAHAVQIASTSRNANAPGVGKMGREEFRDQQFAIWLAARQHMLAGKNNVQWRGVHKLVKDVDYFTTRGSTVGDVRMITEILTKINMANKIPKITAASWRNAIANIQQRAHRNTNNALLEACNQILARLANKPEFNSGVRRKNVGVEGRSYAQTLRLLVATTPTLPGGVSISGKAPKGAKPAARVAPYGKQVQQLQSEAVKSASRKTALQSQLANVERQIAELQKSVGSN